MINLNKKGFMMAEVIVVSAVIMTTLVALYTSYNKIFLIYEKRVKYYDVTTLYELAFIRDNDMYISSVDGIVKQDTNKLVMIEDKYIKDIEGISNINDKIYNRNIFYVDKDEINNIDKSSINKTYQEYIEYLDGSIDWNKQYDGCEFEYVLIMERCKIDNNDDCTYAYLEIPIVDKADE